MDVYSFLALILRRFAFIRARCLAEIRHNELDRRRMSLLPCVDTFLANELLTPFTKTHFCLLYWRLHTFYDEAYRVSLRRCCSSPSPAGLCRPLAVSRIFDIGCMVVGLLGSISRAESQLNALARQQHARCLAVPGGKSTFKVRFRFYICFREPSRT